MRPIEKLLALGATWLDVISTARLLAEEVDDLYDSTNGLDSDPDDPNWARVALRVLSVSRTLQGKMNQRFDGFGREVIHYYRAYLVARDESFQGSVYEDAVRIVQKWEPRWSPSSRAPNLRAIMDLFEELNMAPTTEVQILGEFHTLLDEAEKAK